MMILQQQQLTLLMEDQSTAEIDFIVHWQVGSTANGMI